MNNNEINDYVDIEAPGFMACEGNVEATDEDDMEHTSRNYGKLITFLQRKGEPLIVIGPNCIYNYKLRGIFHHFAFCSGFYLLDVF